MAKVIQSDPSTPPPAPKIAAVIISHGHLAAEMLSVAEMIVGPIPHVTSVSISWHDDIDAAREEVERAISRVSQGRGVLLLTDMFGGAPMNIASMFLGEPGIEVVSGVNLPMVIKLAERLPEESPRDLARRLCDQGKDGIHLANEILEQTSASS